MRVNLYLKVSIHYLDILKAQAPLQLYELKGKEFLLKQIYLTIVYAGQLNPCLSLEDKEV